MQRQVPLSVVVGVVVCLVVVIVLAGWLYMGRGGAREDRAQERMEKATESTGPLAGKAVGGGPMMQPREGAASDQGTK